MCCIPTQHRGNIPIQTTLPLPCLPPPLRNQVSAYLIRQHELKIKNTTMTRLIHMAKHITPDMECIDPHAELPWHRSEHDPDAQECIQLYIPENKPGTSVKLEWAEDHASLYDEYKRDNDFMFVYTDGSLSYYNGVRRTGYGIAIYRNDTEIAYEKGPMGEHIEAYDTEMKALEVALKMIYDIVNSAETPPTKIILSTDNTGALQRIFQGSPGKAQKCSDTFRKHIIDILDQHTNIQLAFTWCPGHFDIEGNERWSNQYTTLRSNFHVANRIPPRS